MLAFCLDQSLHLGQRFSGFITALMHKVGVKEVFPKDFVLFEIDQYCLFATIAISQKFDSRHIHDNLQVDALEIITPRGSSTPKRGVHPDTEPSSVLAIA